MNTSPPDDGDRTVARALFISGRVGRERFVPGAFVTAFDDGSYHIRIDCAGNPEFWLELTIDKDVLEKLTTEQ